MSNRGHSVRIGHRDGPGGQRAYDVELDGTKVKGVQSVNVGISVDDRRPTVTIVIRPADVAMFETPTCHGCRDTFSSYEEPVRRAQGDGTVLLYHPQCLPDQQEPTQ